MVAWVEAGLDLDTFFQLSLSDVARVLRARRKHLQEQIEAQRALNYELAGLISFAVHAPKKMPKLKRLDAQRVPNRPATEADHAIIKNYFKKLVRAFGDG